MPKATKTETMEAKVARLERENEELKAKSERTPGTLSVKVGYQKYPAKYPKGHPMGGQSCPFGGPDGEETGQVNIRVYGLNAQWPITFYASQARKFLDEAVPEIEKLLEESEELTWDKIDIWAPENLPEGRKPRRKARS